MRVRTFRNWLNNVLDVVDRVRYAGILRYALISEVDLTVSVNRYVLQQSVALDSVVDTKLITLA